jgi:hypothetical protein
VQRQNLKCKDLGKDDCISILDPEPFLERTPDIGRAGEAFARGETRTLIARSRTRKVRVRTE